jgi:hypothetical protein
MAMARKRLCVASLMLRGIYNDCGVIESVGECWKNERGGCEFVFSWNENGWNYWQVQKFGLRLELFKFMGYLICMG